MVIAEPAPAIAAISEEISTSFRRIFDCILQAERNYPDLALAEAILGSSELRISQH